MLPQIKHPVFTLDLPISKKKIKFRPMLVKEEKMLLLAKAGKSDSEIIENLKAVISNCVLEPVDLENMPLVEVEFIFLNLRSKSINNIIPVIVSDDIDPRIKHKVQIDLDEVSIKTSKVSNIVQLQDDIGVKLKVPTLSSLKRLDKQKNMEELSLATLKECIEAIFDGETQYSLRDVPSAEIDKFIDGLSSKHIELLKAFFDDLPRLDLKVEYTNSQGNPKSVTLDTFADFFQ